MDWVSLQYGKETESKCRGRTAAINSVADGRKTGGDFLCTYTTIGAQKKQCPNACASLNKRVQYRHLPPFRGLSHAKGLQEPLARHRSADIIDFYVIHQNHLRRMR